MITVKQVDAAFGGPEPGLVYSQDQLSQLTERANAELSAWGHADHQVAVERVTAFFADSGILGWAFWCESCHVSPVASLGLPRVR